jgi:transcription antitermination factor NusB
MIGPRRRSRVIALQIIHQMDVSPEMDADAALSLYFGQLARQTSSGADVTGADGGDDDLVDDDDSDDRARAPGSVDRPLIEELVRGVSRHRDELHGMLSGLSRNWRIERMALVDRNVIRLALYELKYCMDVPASVVINEAIELAKQFGSAEAGAFVNGLLDRAVGELHLER